MVLQHPKERAGLSAYKSWLPWLQAPVSLLITGFEFITVDCKSVVSIKILYARLT